MSRKHEKYENLIARCQALHPIPTAVAHPCDESSLRSVVDAAALGIMQPILVGPQAKIKAVAEEFKLDITHFELVDAPHSHAAAEEAVRLAREAKAEMLMKGSLHTDELMGAVVRSASGLRTERRISHVFILDVPSLDRPLFITDAAINIMPTLEDKQQITQNGIDVAHALGLSQPKVAILSAVETVNPAIPSTLDAAALCKMADRGQITGALLDGPLAFDNAVSAVAAQIKGIRSTVAGAADILVTPDMEAGNMLAKQLEYLANAEGAGIVLGLRIPVILTSRADDTMSRMASCALASVMRAHQLKRV